MQLSDADRHHLAAHLARRLPTWGARAQVARDAGLAEAPLGGDARRAWHDLVDYAVRHRRVPELLASAASARPEDAALRDLASQARQGRLVVPAAPNIEVARGMALSGAAVLALGLVAFAGDALRLGSPTDAGASRPRWAADPGLVVEPDVVPVGAGDHAAGAGDVAVGAGEVAVGAGEVAVGGAEVAVGAGDVAVGAGDVAVGAGDVAVGAGEVAVGGAEVAVGGAEVAVGGAEVAVGAGDVAVGAKNVAVGAKNVAVGAKEVAVGSRPLAPPRAPGPAAARAPNPRVNVAPAAQVAGQAAAGTLPCVSRPGDLIGYAYAGERDPGRRGSVWTVPFGVNVRQDYPRRENGYRTRSRRVCVLRRGERIVLEQAPIAVDGGSWYVPVVSPPIEK